MPRNGYKTSEIENNAEWLIKTIYDFASKQNWPFIIVGDFNTTLDGISLPKKLRLLVQPGKIDLILVHGRIDLVNDAYDIFEPSNCRNYYRNFSKDAFQRLIEQRTSLNEMLNVYRVSGSHVPTRHKITLYPNREATSSTSL